MPTTFGRSHQPELPGDSRSGPHRTGLRLYMRRGKSALVRSTGWRGGDEATLLFAQRVVLRMDQVAEEGVRRTTDPTSAITIHAAAYANPMSGDASA